MITLFCAGPGFQLPELSPYVTKTEVHLKMAKVPYRKERSTPQQAPKGKVPFIHDDEAVVPDSTFIRAHIEQKYGVDLDAGLSDKERAESWTIERLLEDHLQWASAHSRWVLKENFAKGPAHFFDGAPEEAREKLRADLYGRVSETMYRQGIGRHSDEEIAELGARSLKALSTLLGDKPYFMGQLPTAVDATAFGVLAGILTPFFDSRLRRAAEQHENLVRYVERMMHRYYPEHAWRPELAAAE